MIPPSRGKLPRHGRFAGSMRAGCFAGASGGDNSFEFIFTDQLLEPLGWPFMYFYWNISRVNTGCAKIRLCKRFPRQLSLLFEGRHSKSLQTRQAAWLKVATSFGPKPKLRQ
jgi:hypothetical protein